MKRFFAWLPKIFRVKKQNFTVQYWPFNSNVTCSYSAVSTWKGVAENKDDAITKAKAANGIDKPFTLCAWWGPN